MTDFVHLHLHTEYSLLDGACRIEKLMDAAEKLGQKSIAITDHGVMYGAVDFYKAAKKHGIKPIIGCEVYVAARGMDDKVHALDSEHNHLILLCKNETGYKNLIYMVSEAWTRGFYGKPRIDHELLKEHSDGLIAMSACLAGEIPRALVRGDYESAKKTAQWYKDVFGEDYYIELQDHGIADQKRIMPQLLKLSSELNIPVAATNDTHYIEREDSKVQEVLICIQTNHVVGEATGLEFESDEFYLKSGDEMAELFSYVPEAIENTVKIAEKCNLEFEFGKTKLPHFDVPEGQSHFDYFKNMCLEGFNRLYGENAPKEYRERLDYELGVINQMGYVDYYLIVRDFIAFAKSKDIPVGPGRGSGAGSIAAYCVGITGIDPMKYDLLFERFLNPERVSMPDFDIDFCYERRSEVIDYVIEKYGADHVAQIVTFGTMAARAAVRDVGRALGFSYGAVDSVAKLIPMRLNMTIEKAMKITPELKERYEKEDEVKRLLDMALKVEGMPRHASTHAAGVVITHNPVYTYVPLAKNDESVVTQFTMTTLEELGLLKMDFLGLRTLTVIHHAQEMIRKKEPEFDIEKIDLEDKETFAMFSRGQTEGVFQFESDGMKNVLMGLCPERVEDLIAVTSLYRPGPVDSIPTYIRNKKNPDKIVYKTPLLKNILSVTYGCMVYQEQVMQIFRTLAGYSYGRADIVRRAMAKKKHDVMEKERNNFIYGLVNEDGTVECEGCVKRGVDEKTANEIFDEMISFASYAFNKSHAAAYAVVAYRTAYLKCHYPAEFMAALLTSILDNSGKVAEYTAECARLSIKVMPPDVNESVESFGVTDKGIAFGLLAVKNLGRGLISRIVEERESGGKYTSFYSFCKRIYGKDFNRRAVESLIKCGALDSLGANRRQMLSALPMVMDDLEYNKRKNIDGQIGLFDVSPDLGEDTGPELPNVSEMPYMELLQMEKETTGLYLSGHPMRDYEALGESIGSAKSTQLIEASEMGVSKYKDGSRVLFLGMIASVTKKTTKRGDAMAFINLEDVYGTVEAVIFPTVLAAAAGVISENAVVVAEGRLSLREDEEPKIICDSLKRAEEYKMVSSENQNSPQKKRKRGLFLRFSSEKSPKFKKAVNLIEIFEGMTPVYYYFSDTEEYRYSKLLTQINEPLIEELERLLGSENVKNQE